MHSGHTAQSEPKPFDQNLMQCTDQGAPAAAKAACVQGDSSRLAAAASAAAHWPKSSALCACATATKPELHAVSTTSAGPVRPCAYAMRPARTRLFHLNKMMRVPGSRTITHEEADAKLRDVILLDMHSMKPHHMGYPLTTSSTTCTTALQLHAACTCSNAEGAASRRECGRERRCCHDHGAVLIVGHASIHTHAAAAPSGALRNGHVRICTTLPLQPHQAEQAIATSKRSLSLCHQPEQCLLGRMGRRTDAYREW